MKMVVVGYYMDCIVADMEVDCYKDCLHMGCIEEEVMSKGYASRKDCGILVGKGCYIEVEASTADYKVDMAGCKVVVEMYKMLTFVVAVTSEVWTSFS